MPTNQYSIGGVQGDSGQEGLGKLLEGIGFPLRTVGEGNSSSPSVPVTGDVTALPGQFLNVTCTTQDITISLPDATLYEGRYITIRKADATAFKVLVPPLGDITFQGTSIVFYSTGQEWVTT